jgi:uncharacterized membrane protein
VRENDEVPFGAKVINGLATIGLTVVLATFLAPIVMMVQHQRMVSEAKREWEETCRRENEKTERAIQSFQELVKKQKERGK